jgi:LPXTG-motif cell wall-anchored protein
MKQRRGKKGETVSGKLSLLALALAGLGVGLWLFRSKRRKSAS